MDNKRIAFLRLLLVATIAAGCTWAVKAGFNFFGLGNASGGDGDDIFDDGPEGEVFTAEGVNDTFNFAEVGSDSLEQDNPYNDNALINAVPNDDGFGGAPGDGAPTPEQASGFDAPYHTHTVDYYTQHNPELYKDEEELVPYHPVSVYDRKNKKEKGETNVEK